MQVRYLLLLLAGCSEPAAQKPLPPQTVIACKVSMPHNCNSLRDKMIAEGCKVLTDISDKEIDRREVTLECTTNSQTRN